jgi:propanediol dehydratase small subunit
MEVYRALHPTNALPDNWELEFFAENLKKKYRIDLFALANPEITLGDIFRLTMK